MLVYLIWVLGLPKDAPQDIGATVQYAKLQEILTLVYLLFYSRVPVVEPNKGRGRQRWTERLSSHESVSISIGNGEIPSGSSKAPAAGERAKTGVVGRTDRNTTYTESVELVKETEPRGILNAPFNPYLPSGVEAAITKSYKVAGVPWAATDQTGETLWSMNMPGEFIAMIPTLVNKLSREVFMRSKIKMTFSLNTTSMEQGVVMICWAPAYDADNTRSQTSNADLSVYVHSYYNPILLSAAAGKSIEFELPWLWPKMYRALDDSQSMYANGMVKVVVLHPLVSTSPNPPADVTIAVYACIVDPDVAGIDPTVAPAVQTRSWIAEEKKNRRKSSIVVKGQSAISDEQKTKSTTGLVAGVPMSQSDPAPVGILAAMDNVVSAVSKVGEFVSIVGGSAPLDLASTTVNIATSSTMEARTKRPGTALAMSRDCLITKHEGIISFDNPQGVLQQILCIPGMIRFGSIRNVTYQPGDLILSIANRPQGGSIAVGANYVTVPTYAMHYGFHAKYWHGTMRYMIAFRCAKNVTARVRIGHLVRTPPVTIADFDTGDFYGEVFDISGDCDLIKDLPWLGENWYLSTGAFIPSFGAQEPCNGYLAVYLESVIGSMDTSNDPPIYFSIWQAATKDFELEMQNVPPAEYDNGATSWALTRNFVDASPFVVKGQCDVRTAFSKAPGVGLIPMTPRPIGNLLFNDPLFSVTDMMRRPYTLAVFGAAGSTTILPFPTIDIGNDITRSDQLLVSPFLGFRGGIMLAIVRTAADAIGWESSNPVSGDMFQAGVAQLNTQLEWVLRPFQQPNALWLETVPWYWGPENANVVVVRSACTLVGSVADDFSLGHPLACPFMVWTTGAAEKKSKKKATLEISSSNK